MSSVGGAREGRRWGGGGSSSSSAAWADADSLYSSKWFLGSGGGGGKGWTLTRALVEVVRSRLKVDAAEKSLLIASVALLEAETAAGSGGDGSGSSGGASGGASAVSTPRVDTRVLGEARAAAKTILNTYRLYDAVRAAAGYLPTKAASGMNQGSKRKENPQQAARDHGFAAVEFLASVVEFDGFDDLTLEGEGKYARAAPTPQKLAYALAAMRGARAELKAFADAFNADGTYDAAQEYYFDLIASGRG